MKVRDLQRMYFERVVLYVSVETEDGFDYEDLYSGDVAWVPDKFLDYKVCTLGAKRKGLLDIRVEPN